MTPKRRLESVVMLFLERLLVDFASIMSIRKLLVHFCVFFALLMLLENC